MLNINEKKKNISNLYLDQFILNLFIFLFYILQNLDLTKKTLIHEGPLSWKVNKDKTIGL